MLHPIFSPSSSQRDISLLAGTLNRNPIKNTEWVHVNKENTLFEILFRDYMK